MWPLIDRAPWIEASVGARTSVLAELIDVFPTMADLTGIPLPPGEVCTRFRIKLARRNLCVFLTRFEIKNVHGTFEHVGSNSIISIQDQSR